MRNHDAILCRTRNLLVAFTGVALVAAAALLAFAWGPQARGLAAGGGTAPVEEIAGTDRQAPVETAATPLAEFAATNAWQSTDEVPSSLLAPPPRPASPLESPFVAVARRVVPAVVSVESGGSSSGGRGNADLFRRLFPDRDGDDEDGDEGEQRRFTPPSSGSGFIFDAAGYIFTNDHVVRGSEKLTVHLDDGRTYEAWLVGTDPGTDVAVIKIDLPSGDAPLPVIPLGDSDEIRVGDWAIAVGNPLGELESSMTVGVISAKGRSDLRIAGGGPTYQDFLQTDASINFGNSGGPLLNARGEVVGINSAVNPTGQGLGFTIPINMAREVGLELLRNGTIRRGYLGIFPQEITSGIRQTWDMPNLRGILVGSVEDDTPAMRGGLEVGDVILEFNRHAIRDVQGFRAVVADAGVGVDVPILILRDGEEKRIRVVLAQRPDTVEPPAHRRRAPSEDVWLGATWENITGKLTRTYELQVEQGVVVTGVERGSAAHVRGLREGDVILELNREAVADAGELERRLNQAHRTGKAVVLLVQRGTTTTFVELPTG